jgi:hypothetical protein
MPEPPGTRKPLTFQAVPPATATAWSPRRKPLPAASLQSVRDPVSDVTAIEAVLGEDKPGLTESLKSRLSAALSEEPGDRKKLRKRFDAIYKDRSHCIHGDVDSPKPTDPRALVDARDDARRVVVWMLRYLGHVRRQVENADLPTRDVLLQALDMDTDRRRDLSRLLAVLPQSFPKASAP